MQSLETFSVPTLSADEIARHVQKARALRSQALNHWIQAKTESLTKALHDLVDSIGQGHKA
ncbi:hypothetical protein [Reinekea sp.]|jgi:hypothetical protein|uniref:hypothetical protein n=1 Tax=Reinekea sp. TaxID=1970455 RepID=UPI002A7FE28C|nr:hypothetical protein [Reinekea sp.]